MNDVQPRFPTPPQRDSIGQNVLFNILLTIVVLIPLAVLLAMHRPDASADLADADLRVMGP